MIDVRRSTFGESRRFAEECYEHYGEYLGYHPDLIERAFEYYEEIFIVNKANKDLGFFRQIITQNQNEISCEMFPSPRCCNLGLLSIVKVATVRTYLVAKNYSYKAILIRVRDPLSARTIKRLLPGMNEHRLGENNLICYSEVSKLNPLNFAFETYDRNHNTFRIDI